MVMRNIVKFMKNILSWGYCHEYYRLRSHRADITFSITDQLYHNMTALDPTEDFEDICSKCGRMNEEHPATGRFITIILFGDKCA